MNIHSSKEILEKLLFEYMQQHPEGGDIQLGNFIIKQQTQSPSQTLNIKQEPINKTNLVEQQAQTNVNNFVMDCFNDVDCNLTSLENFILQDPQQCNNEEQKAFSQSDKSHKVSKMISKRQSIIEKQIFPKVYNFLDSFQEFNLRDQLESALHDDFEQLLKPHISISASSNTHLSVDTLTTLAEAQQADPLRAFLISLVPSSQGSHSSSNLSFSPAFCQKQSIDFLYIYSQPLVSIHNQSRKAVPVLEVKREMSAIVDVLNSEGAELKFYSIPARVDQFGEALDLMPLVVHYSGHGIQIDGTSHLLFETKWGSTNLISPQTLKQILSKLQRPILFVFVASCHSRLIGEVFQQAGATHVVCVNTNDKIMDEVCRLFARAFYHAILRGEVNVCQAFQIAKNQIKAEGRFPLMEENKFVILTRSQDCPFQEHKCQVWKLGLGTFKNQSKIQKYQNTIPGQVAHFMGRCLILQETIEKVVHHKLVSIRGILGIGKSAILKELANYISERMIFKDGVIYMSIAHTDSFDCVATQLYQILFPSGGFLRSNSEMKQLIITQLVQTLKIQEILIVLDNCDQVLSSSDREVFQDFIEILISNCSSLHLCLSSRQEFFTYNSAGKTIYVDQLSNEDSLQLLFAYAQREITRTELEEVIGPIPEQNSEKFILQKLSQHQLMSYLDGHPQAIILSAGLFENNTLKQLCTLLCAKSWAEIPSDESQSLKLSLDLSWNNLYERYEKASQLFAMLGLLPGGATTDDLESIWGQGWEKWRTQLIRSSMVTQYTKLGKIVWQLHNFIIRFAESKLEQKQVIYYHSAIVRCYGKKIQQVYQVIGTQIGGKDQYIDTFLQMEPNLKATIMRELKFAGLTDVDNYFSEQSKQGNILIKKKSDLYEEDEEKDFNLPLTKENLEIVQKRYEKSQKNTVHSDVGHKQSAVYFLTNSVQSNKQTLFDQSSEEHRKSTITEQAHYRRKSMSIYQTQITISEEIEVSEALSIETEEVTLPQLVGQPPNLRNKSILQFQLEVKDISQLIKPVPSVVNPDKITKNKGDKKTKRLQFEDQLEKKEPKDGNKDNKSKSIKNTRAKSLVKKENTINQITKNKTQQLIIYHCQILMLIRRYNESLKIINLCARYLINDGDELFLANLLKTKACVFYLQKDYEKSRENFEKAKNINIKQGCMLGVCSCEAAIGYIFLQAREFQQAKVCFENSLYIYELLNHDFGRHFLNRWLALVKNKISSLKNTRLKHIQEEKQLIEHLKIEYKRGIKIDNLIHKKHKGGHFVLRWLGDTISIFMEPSFIQDSNSRAIRNILKNPMPNWKKKENPVVKLIDFHSQQDIIHENSSKIQKLQSPNIYLTAPIKKTKESQSKQKLNNISEEEDKEKTSEDINEKQKKIQIQKKETFRGNKKDDVVMGNSSSSDKPVVKGKFKLYSQRTNIKQIQKDKDVLSNSAQKQRQTIKFEEQ